MVRKALGRLRIYNLVQGGLFTYEQLGLPIPIPTHILEEHIIIQNIYGEAREEKKRLDNIK